MLTTLTQICEYLRNWFAETEDRISGSFVIENGTIALPFVLNGEHIRIFGSRLNDGVYQYPVSGLADESFEGQIWRMRVPQSVLALADEVAAFNADSANTASPFTSESFGGYSYTKSKGVDGVSAYSWQDAFRSRLKRWRKVDFVP